MGRQRLDLAFKPSASARCVLTLPYSPIKHLRLHRHNHFHDQPVSKMPALLSPQTISQSSTSAPLQARQFGQSTPSTHVGRHPAAIFGIVAGVMLLFVVVKWCCIFRVWKTLTTNKDYGVLPSARIAANRYGGSNNHQYSQ